MLIDELRELLPALYRSGDSPVLYYPTLDRWLAEAEAMQAEIEKLRGIIERFGSDDIYVYRWQGKFGALSIASKVHGADAETRLAAIEKLLAAEAKEGGDDTD